MLVNQLPNQNEFNFEEQSPMLNVIDLNSAASTGLDNPELMSRHIDNLRTKRNRKSTNMSNPQSRVNKDCNLFNKDIVSVDKYRVHRQLVPQVETVLIDRLLSQNNLEDTIQSEEAYNIVHLEGVDILR